MKFPRGLWDRIDEYWHRAKLASRTEAVRALLEKGLGEARSFTEVDIALARREKGLKP